MSLLGVFCAATSLMWAEPVGQNAAKLIASKYLSNPELQSTTALTRATGAEKQPAYYLFTNASDNRFVVVSGESKLNEVGGYWTF